MHAARLHKSPRLQNTLRELADGQEHSTRALTHNGGAVRSTVAELRANGIKVFCRCVGHGQYVYRLGDGT